VCNKRTRKVATVSDKSRRHKLNTVQCKTAKEMVSDCIKIMCNVVVLCIHFLFV